MAEVLSFTLASLEAVLALVVLRHLARFGRAFPWLGALMAFFLVRAADRYYVAFRGDEPLAFSLLVDGLAVLLLTLLIFGIRRMVRGLLAVENEAAIKEAEYERALVDYRRLMRHRIANPLTALRGGIQSLRDLHLSREDQAILVDSVLEAVGRLEHVALNPSPLGKEEAALEGRPRLAGLSRRLPRRRHCRTR
jgi:signal transduction histidine kinase